jgi:ML domain
MFSKALVLLALIAVASAARVNIRACPGGLPMPLWFESNDCTTTRCTLRRGQVFTGRASVTPAATFNTLMIELRATLFGIPFPLQIPAGYENACNFLEAGMRCPVQPGVNVIWGLQFPVDSSYPAAQGVVIQRKSNPELFIRNQFLKIFIRPQLEPVREVDLLHALSLTLILFKLRINSTKKFRLKIYSSIFIFPPNSHKIADDDYC